jgi:hypothetical protein
VQVKDQSQSELRVPRDTLAIEAPKAPIFGFNPAVFRARTLVPIKRVLGVPLVIEIIELMAQPQRANNRHAKLRVV